MKHEGVEGGTPRGKPLCRTCSNAEYIRGRSQTQVILRCGAIYEKLPFEAVECSLYDRNQAELEGLEKIAWLVVRFDGKVVGFAPPKDEEE